jgi:hypothetical protein
VVDFCIELDDVARVVKVILVMLLVW